MMPYRAPPEAETVQADSSRSPPYFLVAVLLLAALWVMIVIVNKQNCGVEIGLATVVLGLSGRAISFKG